MEVNLIRNFGRKIQSTTVDMPQVPEVGSRLDLNAELGFDLLFDGEDCVDGYLFNVKNVKYCFEEVEKGGITRVDKCTSIDIEVERA